MAKLSEQLMSGAVTSAPSNVGKTKLSSMLMSGGTSTASKPVYTPRGGVTTKLPSLQEQKTQRIQSYSDPSHKMTSEEKREVKDAYKALKQFGVEKNTYNEREKWQKALESGAVDADYANAVINAHDKASAEGAAYSFITGLGSTFAKPITATASAVEKLSGSGKTDWQEANNSREEALATASANHSLATGAGKLAGSMVQYNAVNGVLGEGAKLSTRLLKGQLADTLIDTIPEIANNAAQGKYDGNGKQLAKDIATNQATNLAFNLGGEALEAIPGLIKNVKAKKATEETVNAVKNATDSVTETAKETVEDVAKNVTDQVDDVVKEIEPLSNKQINDILSDPAKKAAWEEANGVTLSGTKAEQRKAIKDYYMAESSGLGDSVKAETTKTEMPEEVKVERKTADEIADDILKRKDATPETKLSKVGQRKFDSSDPDEIARVKSGFYDYLESSEKQTVTEAKEALSKNYDETFKRLTTADEDVLKTFGDSDIDAGFLLADRLKRLKNEALEKGNVALANKLDAQIAMVKGNLRKSGTELGRGVQAFRKWTNTADGAIANGEDVFAKNAQRWASTNVNASKKVSAIAEKLKSSATLDKALANMGNDGLKAKSIKPPKPKTHAQIYKEVENSIAKELSSVSDKFSKNDIEYLTSLVENKVPSWQITDELSQWFKNGEWYSLDESTPVKKEVEGKLKAILSQIGNDGSISNSKVKELTHADFVERVKNTLDDESASILKDFTEDDIDYIANLMENNIPTTQLKEMLESRIANGVWGVSEDTVKRVNELFDLAALKDINSKERVELEAQAYAAIAEDVYKNGGTIFEKFDEWRYLAMLGNPKTHIRNVTSNVIFSGVTSTSNSLAAVMENLVDKVVKNKNGIGIERTKAIINPASAVDRKLVSGAFNDAEQGAYRQLTGSSRYFQNAKQGIESKRKVFSTKAMSGISELNSKLLELEDFATMRTKYSTSLAGYLKANGYDDAVFEAERRLKQLQGANENIPSVSKEMQELKKQVEVLQKGREYAIKQAEYTAFHEDNAFADFIKSGINKARNSDKVGMRLLGRAMEGVMPFAKTPANILKSGIEYSPLNAIMNIADINKVVKGSMSASDYIEGLSKTLTGSMLFATGMYLHSKGKLSTGSDEQTGKFDSNQGKQPYALKIGGKTITVDFAVPAVMAVLVGGEVSKLLQNAGYDDMGDFFEVAKSEGFEEAIKGIDLNEVINSAVGIADPITDTSMLSGLNDTLKSIQYGEGGALGTLAANTLTGYVTQAVPTVMGQVARSVDNTRRATYTQHNGAVGQFERQLNKVTNKIPFVSRGNEAYVDLWGRENKNFEGSNLGNAAYQFLSPSYVAKINETPVDKELQRLYDVTKEASVLPSPQGYNVGGQRLSEKDYHDYAQKVGQTRYAILEEAIKSSAYQNATDEQKKEYVSQIYSLANKVGKYSITGDDSDESSTLYKEYKSGGEKGVLEYLEKKFAFDSVNVSITTKSANEIWEQRGIPGLQDYKEIVDQAKSMSDKNTLKKENVITTLKESNLSSEDKYYYFDILYPDSKEIPSLD